MAKWVIKLNKIDISYQPRSSLKAWILVDFLVKCTWLDDKIKEAPIEQTDLGTSWILHVNEASYSQESGGGLILTNSEGVVVDYALYFSFKVINNQAEMEIS